MDNNAKSGPESKVTIELVHRVSARVAKGIPVRAALADEPVSYSAYRQQLRRHPELAAIQAAAKIKFLDTTFDMIFSKPNALVRWILERRHPPSSRPFCPPSHGLKTSRPHAFAPFTPPLNKPYTAPFLPEKY